MKELLKHVNEPQIRKGLPKLQVGDLVQVYVKIKEGNRERVQMFDGTIIAMKNGNTISATFTVRKIASGVGVEKTFMVNSPSIDKIKIVRHGKVRRAKLYYLRDRVGKAAKVQERIVSKSAEAVETAETAELAPIPVEETKVEEVIDAPKEEVTEIIDEKVTETPKGEVAEVIEEEIVVENPTDANGEDSSEVTE